MWTLPVVSIFAILAARWAWAEQALSTKALFGVGGLCASLSIVAFVLARTTRHEPKGFDVIRKD
jgi:hypothetical protein